MPGGVVQLALRAASTAASTTSAGISVTLSGARAPAAQPSGGRAAASCGRVWAAGGAVVWGRGERTHLCLASPPLPAWVAGKLHRKAPWPTERQWAPDMPAVMGSYPVTRPVQRCAHKQLLHQPPVAGSPGAPVEPGHSQLSTSWAIAAGATAATRSRAMIACRLIIAERLAQGFGPLWQPGGMSEMRVADQETGRA